MTQKKGADMDFDKYKNALPYPTEAEFRTTFWYKGGKLVAERRGEEAAVAHVSGLRLEECTKEVVVDKDALRAARAKYNAETARLTELFRQDMFEDLGIENHPLREKLYSKAWNDGHSAGLSEVYNCAQDLVDLIEVPRGAVLITKDAVLWGGLCPSADASEAAVGLQKEL